jgi:hypothetical protein
VKSYASLVVVFTLIGDLVGSRRATSRSVAQAGLETALRATSAVVAPVDRLETTVGDEFQGVYADLGQASLASLLVRLNLPTAMDARCGLGVGEREVFGADRTPMLQDGEAWWGARAALEALGEPPGRSRRTAYDDRYAEGAAGPAQLVNAFLIVRDGLVDRLNDRSRRMLRRSLEGASQHQIAAEEGISDSAVSQAFAKGVSAVRDAQRMFSPPPTPSP